MNDFYQFRVLCDIPQRNAELYPDRLSHKFRAGTGFETRTWKVFAAEVDLLAAGLDEAGVKAGDHVALFADNRYDWAVTDQALLSLSAPSVPRGSDTTPKEQKFIFDHSDSKYLILEGLANLESLYPEFTSDDRLPELVFLMDDPEVSSLASLPIAWKDKVRTYSSLRSRGGVRLADKPELIRDLRKACEPTNIASIIYTSGTSGNPKGVMLTHANFLHNVRAISPLLHVDRNAGEVTVSILPIWHVYERCFEFCTSACMMMIYYSSVRTLSEDLIREKPTIMASVPRVWESVYLKIRDKILKEHGLKKGLILGFVWVAQARYRSGLALRGWRPTVKNPLLSVLLTPLHAVWWLMLSPFSWVALKALAPMREVLGGRLRASFSGGGSLPVHVDTFFNTIGVTLVNAYGMTESSPGSITRRIERNVPSSIGVPLDEVEVRIVREDGSRAALTEKGMIHVRGPNVMEGYYKNPHATGEVLSADRWLNTGDLGALTWSGDYIITGRAKSTIVLIGGENIEPEPIEEKLQESELIDHAVVLGQDKKTLEAVITVNHERLKHLAEKWKISWEELTATSGESMKHNRVLQEISKEIKRLVNRENGFKPFENISKFVALRNPFKIGDELTQKLSVKRKVVEQKYQHLLDEDKVPKK
ncbi:MAG: AMP-binding protein [Spirochaetales bacterium]